MTIEQTILEARTILPRLLAALLRGGAAFRRSRILTGTLFLGALTLAPGGCAQKEPQLVAPQALTAPYDVRRGDVLWAVVPLRNESGTTIAEPYLISDKIVAAASQVRGVRCLPLNRTIGTMRSLDMTELNKPEDAEKLAKAMGVDGLIVGSVTAYDPYNPPRLGLALALYTRPGLDAGAGGTSRVDTRQLTYQPTEYRYFPRSSYQDAPASVVSEFMDGKNHQVQMDVQAYAMGRHDERTALGWRRYLASMDLFSEFGAWHCVSRLLEHEWIRTARVPAGETDKQP